VLQGCRPDGTATGDLQAEGIVECRAFGLEEVHSLAARNQIRSLVTLAAIEIWRQAKPS
jgi:hypothetical protein